MRKLFGTDGIRGIAGQAPLDPETIYAAGLAVADSLKGTASEPVVIIGMDTRESGPWIAATFSAGLREGGVSVRFAGVITTPAIAFLAARHSVAAGVVISASHNPWQDNGIKVFGNDGYKLPDKVELAIEVEIFKHLKTISAPDPKLLPPLETVSEYCEQYIASLEAAVPELSPSGFKIVVDCANGAASSIAPKLFGDLGCDLRLTHARPDGRNINEHCGALYPEVVANEVKSLGADLGITLDGDADRVLFADANGAVVNGDAVMLLAARDLKRRQALAGDTLVATTMSNMGLEAALKRSGIRMLRAPVGDKYVLEEMQRTGASLGGEQSGHILFAGRSTTGDGLLTALLLLDIIRRSGRPLHELKQDLKVYPQIIENVRVREKRPLDQIPSVTEAVTYAEQDLAENGRVVVRYSGTEALARVMIEAESEEKMRWHAHAISSAIRNELGI